MKDSYKAILFDFDFTLGDSSSGICDAVSYALRERQFPPANDAAICKLIGMPLEIMFSTLTQNYDPNEAERFKILFRERAKEVVVQSSSLYDNVPALLLQLQKRKMRTGIVSTKLRLHLEGIFDKHGCRSFIDLMIGGDDVKHHKPNPEGLFLALKRMKLQPSEVMYVGDTIYDADAASQAGIDFIGVLTGTTDRNAFQAFPYRTILEKVQDLEI